MSLDGGRGTPGRLGQEPAPDERAVKRVLPSEEEGRLLARTNEEGRALPASTEITFDGPDGHRLRGRLRRAQGAPRGAVVLCHPHPAFGGNMDVWLLPAIGRALAADGWHVLRFDFRSVRDGVSADGPATAHAPERADLGAALAFLRDQGLLAGGRLVVGGWSFGALVALLHGLDAPEVTDWVGIAPAVGPAPGRDGDLPMAPVPAERVAAWPARRIVISGRHDQFYPPDQLGVLRPQRLLVLEHADHFFFDADAEVAALVRDALREEAA